MFVASKGKSGEVWPSQVREGLRSMDLITKNKTKKEVESFYLKSDVILYQFKVMALAAAESWHILVESTRWVPLSL